MKFTVQVSGEAALGLEEQDFEFEAANGNKAVDLVRERLHKLMPKEGGLLDVVVNAAEEWVQEARSPRGGTIRETVPPGEVSRFSFMVEPHESVRLKVTAKKFDKELEALSGEARVTERARILVGWTREGSLTQDQLLEAVGNPSLSLESVIEQVMTGKAVSK